MAEANAIDVLLVEDSAADARVMTETLRESQHDKFRVTLARRVTEAAELLLRVTPDVIMLDLTLPDASGMDTVRQMRRHAPGLPIVILTGLADERLATEALRIGVQDYLVKSQLVAHVAIRALRYAIERSKVEKSLTASEERFRLLVETVRDHAIFMLDPAGRVASWNLGAERIEGYGALEIMGEHYSAFFPAEAGEVHRLKLNEAMNKGHATWEGFRTRKDRRQYWAMTTITALYDPHNKHIGFVNISQDLTERNQLETQLRQAQKMEAIGQLTGGIAHDFNNLLTVVIGYSDILLERFKATDPVSETLLAIRDAGEQAAGLTRQLLAFSRKTVLEPKVIDLNAIIQANKKMFERLLGEDLILAMVLDPGIKPVKIDPGHLVQVLMNMAVNARDAMPTGGNITIETSNVYLDETYVRVRPEVQTGAYVLLTMSDTGTGMTAEVKAKIFEPFFTTKGVGKGTGLGLAVVHGIIKQSGGLIEVYSEPGLGTTFKIYLPVVQSMEPEVVKPAAEGTLRGTETILLVEDDPTLRKLATMALEEYGYKLLQAANGDEAMQLLENYQGKVDLLATDVVMPRLGGRALAEAVRPRYPNLKVLYMSGYTDDAIVRHGILQADVAFLQKPYTPNSLRAKVRQTLDLKK